jgi:stress response protein YsnF
MNDAIEEWIERLLADLKSASTTNWGSGKQAFGAMPNTVESIIRKHLDRIDTTRHRSYCERARSHFDQLVEQNDPYAETLRLASERLSEWLKRSQSY